MKSFFEDPTQRFEKFYNAYQDKEHADYDKLYENYDAAVDWPSVFLLPRAFSCVS